MLHAPPGEIDILTIGELVVDFIALEESPSLRSAERFQRYQGGSPANIAVNVAKLGGHAVLIARVGQDAFGQFLRAAVHEAGVDTDFVALDPEAHTSFVFVSRSAGTPDFLPVRAADFRLAPEDIPADLVGQARIIHASTWPLSREPSRSAVRRAFQLGRKKGRLISLDPNYSPRYWPDRAKALSVLTEMCRYVTLIKPSLDDARRLFGDTLPPERYIDRYHAMGAKVVVLTMGKEGTLLSDGQAVTHIPAPPVRAVDATGAGDAFWSGFLLALVDGYRLEDCVRVAQTVAALKLTTVGPLPRHVDRQAFYTQLGLQARTTA